MPARPAVLLAATLLGLLAGGAGAQPAEPLYQVEVVIFSQPSGSTLERLPRLQVPELATGTTPDAESPQVDTQTEAERMDALLEEGFAGPANARRLNAVATRLNTGGYRLLWHQAWVQPALAHGTVELPILAALGQGQADPGLSGAIGLTARRFLHFEVDIELHRQGRLEAKLLQTRRVRPMVDQYMDHSHIGVIAVVSPVEIAADEIAIEADQSIP
jgi:hypothetical protein